MDRQKMKALDASLGPSRTWHKEIIESIRISDHHTQTSPPQLHYVYDTIISGFSAKLTEQHLDSLKAVDGFLSASRDELRSLHTTHSPQFLGLRKGQGLWSAQNLGSDVIIGLVDTGIWPEHPSFNDSGLSPVPRRWKGKCQSGTKFTASNCNRKLIGAAAFFKGYESARDSDGHGTHTASTSGGNLVGGANIFGLANGTAAGMRYTARIAAYKACYESGCADSDIIAAMEQAVKDGVDVLSLSLGGQPMPYYKDIMAIGAFGAITKGVIVSTSAGNWGPSSYTVSNVAPWMMTVAASSTDRSFVAQLRLGDGKIFSGASLFSGKPTKQLPLSDHQVYNTSENAKFCNRGSLSPALVKGKIVICVRGGDIGRVEKGQVVKAAGGAGMILANSMEQGEETIADAHVLPAVLLGFSGANAVINYAKSSRNPKATIEFQGDVYGNRAPVMAAFSSRGPNSVDPNILKPDVTAPGVNILAAWPTNVSPTNLKSDKRRVSFNVLSGTSMSCPHVSGLIALLKSLHRDWSPAAIKSALMTTAYVKDSKNNLISDSAALNDSESATPFEYGSGHVDPERASDPGLIYDISTQDYLDYLCSLKYNSSQVTLFAGKYITCPAASHFRPGDLNYPSFSVIFSRNFTGTTYKRAVTNVGIAVSTYSVKVIEPEGVSITVQPKALKFGKMGEKLSYNVTFKVQKGKGATSAAFGSLEWVSGKYSVRSPIAATWLI
ncbi:subtilisin-like protease [Phtheirospermum japonicum]|uniref:Subtilisin-like protease n=1 Tax=Phtheirospermum japonicum TaxID=374723 RepID=A0A830CCN1_9LAMI|nr:subtilisin-like protease [Phtheirospermum japonicum]